MPRPKPLPKPAIFDWSKSPRTMIEKALFERRAKIAELLDIDPADCEAVRVPQESVNPTGRSFDAYMAQRNSCAEVRWAPLIDLVLADRP